GILRTLPYRNLLSGENHNPLGWGLHLSSVGRPAGNLTAYANFSVGSGIAGLGGDMQYGHYDLLQNPAVTGNLYAPMTLGWCAGLQYNFRPDFFLSAAASQTHLKVRRPAPAGEYKCGTFACLTAFWNILPRVSVAAELDYGRRQNISDAARNAWRLNAMCAFSF
ncbi:MAG: hypothetical protein K2K29_06525, partial [Muribaculaceae bacterium]|nr:hypothetical protein [Muribaculaceae bacterium]